MNGGRMASAVLLAVLGLVALLTACSTAPPPPVVSSPVARTSTPPANSPSQIVAALDDVVGGYNPHTLADRTTVTQALSQLLLPSVFRPADDGTLQLDANLMTSAAVTSHDPFTVTYRIRPDASWSDGAPIAVEDFVYLADAMKTQPGVVDPAGYRLISGIQPGDGGKRVEVTFSMPYPGWKTLFDNLLPAHLLKDAPGGWTGALADSFPAYGGPFSIKTLDAERGEIVLERNERYWEKPAAVDRIVLHRTDQPAMVAALRSGNDQFALAATDADSLKLFRELGKNVPSHTVPRPTVAQVLLRPTSPALSDADVRAAIVAFLDRDSLIAEGTQGGPSARLRADAQILPPSSQDYAPTIPSSRPPARPDPAKAEQLLEAAGYTRQAGTWTDPEGRTLSLVVAAPESQEPYARIARELSRQLIAAGVEVTTVTPPARELFSSVLAAPVAAGGTDGADEQAAPPDGHVAIDIVVGPRPVSVGDPAATLASTFGCAPGADDAAATDDAPRAPANPAAFCDESLQPLIDKALSGKLPLRQAIAKLEPELWSANVAIPLFQLADTLAIGSGVSGVTPGPPLSGPFSSAVNWTRAPR